MHAISVYFYHMHLVARLFTHLIKCTYNTDSLTFLNNHIRWHLIGAFVESDLEKCFKVYINEHILMLVRRLRKKKTFEKVHILTIHIVNNERTNQCAIMQLSNHPAMVAAQYVKLCRCIQEASRNFLHQLSESGIKTSSQSLLQ